MGPEILALIGTILSGLFTNAQNQSLNQEQYEQQKELMGLQHKMNEWSAENADARTRALYNDLQSPESMVEQYKKSGLSIGMMYGQGGAGGQLQQGSQGNGVSIPGKNILAMSNVFDSGQAVQAAQIAKTQAETKNIEADTASKEADLPIKEKQLVVMENSINKLKSEINKNTQEVNRMEAEINNLMAETELKNNTSELVKAQTDVQKALKDWQDKQNQLADVQIIWQGKLYGAEYQKLISLAKEAQSSSDYLIWSAKKTAWEAKIVANTADAQIKKVLLDYAVQRAEAQVWDENKKLQFEKLEAEINNLNWKTATEKQKTEFFNLYDELYGEGVGGMMRTIVEDLWPHFGAGYVNK